MCLLSHFTAERFQLPFPGFKIRTIKVVKRRRSAALIVQQQTYSRTALRVAMRRAAHQILDNPVVLDDPYAFKILPPDAAAEINREPEREQHPYAKAMRSFISVRSRFAEDEFAQAVARGVRQYVALGAGLDTFAWRNPHRNVGVRIFEVDHPATQAWKREVMANANLPKPPATTYVPVDFERESLADCLNRSGFRPDIPAFFSWLGVVPYLTIEAFRSTLRFFGSMAAGSGVVFDYALPRGAVDERSRFALDQLAARVSSVGEPFQLFFMPNDLAEEFQTVRWEVAAELDAVAIRDRYFPGRSETRSGMARLVSAGN
jgi:methyltransferase (TIGR00027 family)